MTAPGFSVREEKSQNLLVLIVDKKGIFGRDVAQKIHEDITTVLVTPDAIQSHGNTLNIPYIKTIPEIPEGNYSHMFFVWDGRSETLHVLEPLLQKASSDKAQFLFITDYHCYTEKLHRFIHQEYSKTVIFLTGDIFGNALYRSTVTTFFEEAQTFQTLQLENVGLKHVYPVQFSDVVTEIVKVGFGNVRGKLLLACQQHGMTELSLAHALQKVDPLIKIDFKKEERQVVFMPEGEYLFDHTYDMTRKLQNSYADLVASKKGSTSQKTGFFFSSNTFHEEAKKSKRRKTQWIVLLVLFLFLLLSPILFTLLYGGLGGAVLLAAAQDVTSGNYAQAASFAKTSSSLFATALSANTFSQKELQLAFLEGSADTLTNALQEGDFFASLLTDGSKAAASFAPVVKGTSLIPFADFLSGINAMKDALTIVNTSTIQISWDGISLKTVANGLQPFASILDTSPALFGFPAKKTYLVLFQNNTELRPGGGFIGSYGFITFFQGKITDFNIHDVYDADGQLKGHIEPPYVIRRYIPEQHWYLRDSNFDVDFSKDSANAAFFLKEETGQKVDGVVGVDLTVVKDILTGIGPVYVPQYQETVTSDNFFLLAETHAEKNTFAGSTQKKDFLSALFAAMQAKMTTTHGFSPKAIVPLLLAVQSKDIVFGFSDPLTQDVFSVNGLSDSLWDGRAQDATTLNDMTGINEANIGVNKANYFVTRTVAQNMLIDKSGSVSGKLTLTYTNSSAKGVWPGGPYKNYLRLILPVSSNLSGVSINGKVQSLVPAITDASVYEAKGFTLPSGLEVDSSTEQNKQMYGFVTTIPEQSTQKIEITYVLGQKVDLSKPTFTYNGWLFKQPGVESYPYSFSLTYPNMLSLLQKPDWTQTNGNSILFNKSLGEDTKFSLRFSQK